MDERLLNDGKPVDEVAAARAERKADRGDELTEDDVAAMLRVLEPTIDTREKWGEACDVLSREELANLLWHQRGQLSGMHRGASGLLHGLEPGDEVSLRPGERWRRIDSLTLHARGVKLYFSDPVDVVHLNVEVGRRHVFDAGGAQLLEFEVRKWAHDKGRHHKQDRDIVAAIKLIRDLVSE